MVRMPKTLALLALLAVATPACVVHDSGRSSMNTGSSSSLEAGDMAKGAATLGAVALCLGFLYLQAGH